MFFWTCSICGRPDPGYNSRRKSDKASGKDTQRPQLQSALGYCRESDTLVVHSMDRLARSLIDLRKIVSDLTSRGVTVEFVKENLRFTGEDSPMSILLLSLLGAVAEFERALILERQREGICNCEGRRTIQRASPSSEWRKGPTTSGASRIWRAEDADRQGVWNQQGDPLLLSALRQVETSLAHPSRRTGPDPPGFS
jgi:hypothetical protein